MPKAQPRALSDTHGHCRVHTGPYTCVYTYTNTNNDSEMTLLLHARHYSRVCSACRYLTLSLSPFSGTEGLRNRGCQKASSLPDVYGQNRDLYTGSRANVLFSRTVCTRADTHTHTHTHTHTLSLTQHQAQHHQGNEKPRDLLSVDSRSTRQSEFALEGNRQQGGGYGAPVPGRDLWPGCPF